MKVSVANSILFLSALAASSTVALAREEIVDVQITSSGTTHVRKLTKASKAEASTKSPTPSEAKATKAPKAIKEKASKAPKSTKSPKETKATKTPKGTKAPKAQKSTKAPKIPV